MRLAGLSVERLRWGLLAGALLLIAVLVALLSYGRYRAVKAWKQIVARSGATITHETDGFTYSQALGGRQIFTLHAKHAVPHGSGKYTLEDGTLVLYGRDGQPADRISGAQFEYDEKQGVAQAAGQVEMEIEPPAGLVTQGPGPRAKGPAGERGAGQAIHVRTSGLTYVKKLGVAATSEDVEIDYAGMHGHAHGAEFDSGQDVVHLLADVRVDGTLRGAKGTTGGTPATLTAAKADLDRDAYQIAMTAPVLRSGGRVGSAGRAVLHVRSDGSLERVEASGGVKLEQQTRTITAASLRAGMNERSLMKSAELAGGVALVDTSAERPMNGAAKTARVAFDDAGFARSAVLDGGVTMSMEDQRGGGPGLQRQMGAQKVTLTMARSAGPGGKRGGTQVSAVEAQGGAWARGDGVVKTVGGKAGGVKTTSFGADDLRLTMARNAAGKDEPQALSGTGHTRVEQRTPDGTVETSVGDALETRFAQQAGGGMEIASAEQTGNVQIKSVPGKAGELPSEGAAERASLDGVNHVLTLTAPRGASSSGEGAGRPRLTRGDTTVAADTIRLMQLTGDAVAEGSVAGTFVNAKRQGTGITTPASKLAGDPGIRDQGSGDSGSAVTHAMAAEAVLHKAAQTMELKGTDAAPARMWQGASQVQAANILLDRGKDEMEAWPAGPGGVVRAVFASEGPGPRAQGPAGQGEEIRDQRREIGKRTANGRERVVRVASARLEYAGASHQAVFTGGVMAEGEDGTVRGQRAVVFLNQGPGSRAQGPAGQSASGPAGQRSGGTPGAVKGQPDPMASSVEKIVMSGAVKVEQPGRTATGEQLLYTAATGEFVLTGTSGHPPRVVDEKQGTMTGATLLFRSPDSTIVVSGESASRRVHTEMMVKK